MGEEILRRILRRLPEGTLEGLSETLDAADLQSLLLEVFARRAARLRPADVLRQYGQNRFVQPSTADGAALRRVDELARDQLPEDSEWLELAPVAPLGSCSALAPVHPNKVLSTGRCTELVADVTNVLALEAALRRRGLLAEDPRSAEPVRLAASHRQLRTQHFEAAPGTRPHFQVVGWITAGRDTGAFHFERAALLEHLELNLRLLYALQEEGWPVAEVRPLVVVWDERLGDALVEDLGAEVELVMGGEEGRAYYDGLRLQLFVRDDEGAEHLVSDGGQVDWTQRLLENRKERLFVSGLGSERLALVCAP